MRICPPCPGSALFTTTSVTDNVHVITVLECHVLGDLLAIIHPQRKYSGHDSGHEPSVAACKASRHKNARTCRESLSGEVS